MSVGFQLPRGIHSRANTSRPQIINLTALPWGPSGNDPSGQFAMPGSPANLSFLLEFQRRYGAADPDQPIPDATGLHHTDYEAALAEIAASNPAWFAERGLGYATGRTDPSWQEIFDAQYAHSIHQSIIDEGLRLGLLNSPLPPFVPNIPENQAPTTVLPPSINTFSSSGSQPSYPSSSSPSPTVDLVVGPTLTNIYQEIKSAHNDLKNLFEVVMSGVSSILDSIEYSTEYSTSSSERRWWHNRINSLADEWATKRPQLANQLTALLREREVDE